MERQGLSIEEEAEQMQELSTEALALGDETLEQVEPDDASEELQACAMAVQMGTQHPTECLDRVEFGHGQNRGQGLVGKDLFYRFN